jgi:hypothetical protein
MSNLKNRNTAREALEILLFCLDSPSPQVQAVAALMRPAIEDARRALAKPASRPADVILPDYKLPCPFRSKNPSPRIEVWFADGEVVRVPCPSLPNKPLNVGRSLRVAVVFYRSRRRIQERLGFADCEHRSIPVAEMTIVRCEDTGETFDAVACNRHTSIERYGDSMLAADRAKARRVAA